MAFVLGIIYFILSMDNPSPSYQLNITPLHAFLNIHPPQNPYIAPPELHDTHALLSLHLDLPRVSQYAAENRRVFIRFVHHADPARRVV